MKKVLFALAWGTRSDDKAGTSNEAMAEVIDKTQLEYSLILAQIEICLAIKKTSQFIPIGEQHQYINTFDCMKMMLDKTKQNFDLNETEIFVLCHQMHWLGCKRVLSKLGVKNAKRIDVRIPYDPESDHWYTRSFTSTVLGYFVRGFSYILRKQVK